MKPYYEQSGITIYHGDCLDVMDRWEGLRTQSFDLLLTDPPYGIEVAKAGAVGAGKRTKTNGFAVLDATDFGVPLWDEAPAYEAIALSRRICRSQIIFGGNYYDLPPTSCWLVWDKDNGGTDFADCELAWTNLNKAVRKLTYRWNGMLQAPHCPREKREHPTQKPEPVIRWALQMAPSSVTSVLDPFMGSGTTLVAAKRLGRSAVGIEREEKYCEIAARRLAQEALPLEHTS